MSTPDPSAKPASSTDDRSHFLAHMGHDLRAPLTNILALSEALTDHVYGPLPSQQADAIRHIRDNGYRMLNMITDLVDLARFETGLISLENKPCDIIEPCRLGLELVQGLGKSRRVTLEFHTPYEKIMAEADARRMRQLVAGVVGAAITSAPAEGKVLLFLDAVPSDSKLTLKAAAFKPSNATSPSDKSIAEGISSPSALHRLRKMSSVSVAMTEKLVQLYGGTFEVLERPEGGIVLSAVLSMTLSDASQSSPAPEPLAEVDGQAAIGSAPASPFILLADDEDIIRSITQDYLESVGYRVVCAVNGREALDLIQEEPPDLVIMDMQMPVLDGLEAMQLLRGSTDPRIARIPLISLSGLATPGHRERCIAAGATRCLAKPFGIKDLELAITETLGAAQR